MGGLILAVIIVAYLIVLAYRGTLRIGWPLPDWHAAQMRKSQRKARKAQARRRRHATAAPPMSAPSIYVEAPEMERVRRVLAVSEACPHKEGMTVDSEPFTCPCGITWFPPRAYWTAP